MKKPRKSVFQAIAEQWFLMEPVLFGVYCSHQIVANDRLHCVMRTGRGKIEYNPAMVEDLDKEVVEEYLKAEIVRILLKHPYDRQPRDCSPTACTLGSDCTLSSYLKWQRIKLAAPEDFGLPKGEYYEWYAKHINSDEHVGSNGELGGSSDELGADSDKLAVSSDDLSAGSGQSDGRAEQSELWEEDELMQVTVNDLIESTKNWGTLSGKIIETIIASTQARVDYRKVLAGFRASCISMRRSLTRMRPNRRTGFANMGSIYRFRTTLLVAVDVSGSVTSSRLADFYSVINRFFRYGVENIDVVQFDVEIGQVSSLSKASRKIEVQGRGGTNFQCVIDYVHSARCYDGVIIFTDGYAPSPVVPPGFRPRILWICEDEASYNTHHKWMELLGRVCVIEI